MKTMLLLPLALALPAFAGPTYQEPIAPAPSLFTWFAGGSIGYLTELEEPMYNLHVGTDTPWNLGGWNVALFAEIGYTEKDDDWSERPVLVGTDVVNEIIIFEPGDFGTFSIGEAEDILSEIAANGFGSTGYDLDIIPITFNVKLERPLSGALNAYFGAGLGAARVDFDADLGVFGRFSDDDWVFTAQVFAGLNYNVNQNFEIYGGARWIYFDDADLSDGGNSGDLDLNDDYLFELGARFNF